MATIKNIKLSNIHSHSGVEGYTLSANVLMDGKKVGSIFDDGWGGPMYIDIPKDIQEEIRRRYAEFITETRKVDEMELFAMTDEEFVERKANGTLPIQSDPDLEFFFNELATLADEEKRFKSALKKGYLATIYVKFYHTKGPTPSDYGYMTSGDPKLYDKILKDAELKSRAVDVIQFNSLCDFIK